MFFTTVRDSDFNSQILFHMIMHALPPSWNPMENLSSCKALLTSGLGEFSLLFILHIFMAFEIYFCFSIPLFHKRFSSRYIIMADLSYTNFHRYLIYTPYALSLSVNRFGIRYMNLKGFLMNVDEISYFIKISSIILTKTLF